MRSTQFDDYLPFEKERELRGRHEPYTRAETAPSDCIVLCIDDRPLLLEIRKATLASHGVRIKTAVNGYGALKLLEQTPVDAIFLEYKQEGMDSEAVAYQIKQRFPHLPVIMLSAYTDIPERVLWLVDEYVMKSELPGGLLRAVQRVKHSANSFASPESHVRKSCICGVRRNPEFGNASGESIAIGLRREPDEEEDEEEQDEDDGTKNDQSDEDENGYSE
jgi:CheY-like chemotaxis protein